MSILYLCGILSTFQICLLPGLIIIKLLKMNGGLLKTIILSFALSLIANHFMVITLVAFKIYLSSTIYAIFLLEVILFMIIYRHTFVKPFKIIFKNEASMILENLSKLRLNNLTFNIINCVICLISITTLLYYLYQIYNNWGSVFSLWDAVVSWNRWALDWYSNKFPIITWHYPQLLPINWSISYVFMGDSTIKLFAKGVSSFFPFFILLAIFDLALRLKQTGYFIGLTATGTLFYSITQISLIMFDGYAEAPIAFMSFTPIYVLLFLSATIYTKKEIANYLKLGAVLSAGSALTKQAGIFVAIIYPLISYYSVLKNNTDFNSKEKIKNIISSCAIIFLLIVPWYIYKQIEINKGIDESELNTVLLIVHKGRTFIERFIWAIKILEKDTTLGIFGAYCLIPITIIFSFFDRQWRIINLILLLPYFAIWAFFYSYDIRNMAIIIPIIGISMGVGIENIAAKRNIFIEVYRKIISVKLFYIFIGIVFFLLSYCLQTDDVKVVNQQIELQKKILDPELNKALYDYHEKFKFKGKIVTGYQILGFLPELDKYYVQDYFCNLELLKRKIRKYNARYLLQRIEHIDPSIMQYIDKKVSKNQFEIISKPYGVYLLIEIKGEID